MPRPRIEEDSSKYEESSQFECIDTSRTNNSCEQSTKQDLHERLVKSSEHLRDVVGLVTQLQSENVRLTKLLKDAMSHTDRIKRIIRDFFTEDVYSVWLPTVHNCNTTCTFLQEIIDWYESLCDHRIDPTLRFLDMIRKYERGRDDARMTDVDNGIATCEPRIRGSSAQLYDVCLAHKECMCLRAENALLRQRLETQEGSSGAHVKLHRCTSDLVDTTEELGSFEQESTDSVDIELPSRAKPKIAVPLASQVIATMPAATTEMNRTITLPCRQDTKYTFNVPEKFNQDCQSSRYQYFTAEPSTVCNHNLIVNSNTPSSIQQKHGIPVRSA